MRNLPLNRSIVSTIQLSKNKANMYHCSSMQQFVSNWQAHLSKWIQPPYIVCMFLRAKLKQETEQRISTASLHYCLFKSTTPIKNIESHCINDMYEMIVIRRNNIDVRYIWSKYLHIQATNYTTNISQHCSKWLRGWGGKLDWNTDGPAFVTSTSMFMQEWKSLMNYIICAR